MSTKQKDLEKLLELKKKQEDLRDLHLDLDDTDKLTRMKLEVKYNLEYLMMSSLQMEDTLKKRASIKEVDVKSEDIDTIVADYKKSYSKESWYKEPDTNNGKTPLTFHSEKELGDFFKDQVAKNKSFVVVDAATNKVLAYSNGDGKLYNGNNAPYTGGEFQASDKDFSHFKMPEPEREGPRTGMQL